MEKEGTFFNAEALRYICSVLPRGRQYVSDRTGIRLATLSAYMYRRMVPSAEKIGTIANRLNLPIEFFFGEQTEEKKSRAKDILIENYKEFNKEMFEEYLKGRNGEFPNTEEMLTKFKRTELIIPYPYNLIDAVFCCPVDVMLTEDQEAGLEEVLNTLVPREMKVIEVRYKEGKTLEETANFFGVTRERVRQIEAKALRNLRHPSRIRYLKVGRKGINKYEDLVKYEEELKAKETELKRLEAELNEKLEMLEMAGKMIAERKQFAKFDAPIDKASMFLTDKEKGIEELDLTVRAFNCLRRKDINTVGDLAEAAKKPDDLIQIRNFGRHCMKEVYDKLYERYGLFEEYAHGGFMNVMQKGA